MEKEKINTEQPTGFKAVLSFFLRFGLSFILLAYVFSKIDIRKTVGAVKSADLTWLFYSLCVFIGIYFILLLRWMVLINALDLKVKNFDVVRLFFAGLFGNLFLPSAIGGDIIKIIGLCRNSDQKPKVVASILLDRLSGFAGIVIIGLTAFTFGYQMINDFALLVSMIILTMGSIAVVLILFNEKIYKTMIQIFAVFPKFKESLMQMHYDVMLLKGRKEQGWKAIGLSCLTQVTLAIVFYFIAKGLHHELSFVYFLIFVPLLCVTASVPSIGGLGAREAGAAYLFSKAGMSTGIAVSMSLINFLFMIIVGILGGLYYVVTLYSRRV